MDNSMLFLWILTTLLLLLMLLLYLNRNRKNNMGRSHSHSGDRDVTAHSERTGVPGATRKSTAWIAENLLEERLENFRNNEATRASVVNTLLAAEVFVISRSGGVFEPGDCSARPGLRGSRLIPVYSSLTRLKKDMRTVSREYSHVHTTKIREWISQLPSNYGLVLNPNFEYTLELQPDDVARLKFELS